MKIEDIEGIGPQAGEQLRAAGVATTESLLELGATRSGREALAKATKLDATRILGWVNRADLYRLDGVGSEYSDLLELAGVDTVVELARRNAANLADNFQSVAAERPNVVRRVPSESVIAGWIAQAKKLPRVVEY
jgi:predicted flap endonuclease-1-like 5' DNA nuclease